MGTLLTLSRPGKAICHNQETHEIDRRNARRQILPPKTFHMIIVFSAVYYYSLLQPAFRIC